MSNQSTMPVPRPRGTGNVTYRCYVCGETLPQSEAILIHIDGKLVAMHGHHQQEGTTTHGR